MKQPSFVTLGLTCALLLAGCAQPTKSLYHWGGYQPQVYEYFKGEKQDYPAQIAALEQELQQAQAKGETPPPGYHAHLGLLYAKLGKDDQVLQQLQTEKTLFPESASYMDFLLNKFKNRK